MKPISIAGTIASIWKSALRSRVFWRRGAMSRTPPIPNISRCIRPRRSTCSTVPPTGRGSPTRLNGRGGAWRISRTCCAWSPASLSNGTGRGAALGLVRLRPTPDNAAAWRDALQERLAPDKHDGIISMHLLESEPELSGATARVPAVRNEGARDWFVLIDGTHVGAVSAVIAARFTGPAASPFPLPVSVGTYSLMWDLAKSDIARN